MKQATIVLLTYLVIGIILGIVATSMYKRHFGYGSPFAEFMMIMCCMVAWPIAFPDMMLDLKRAVDKQKEEQNNQDEDL